MTKHLDSINSPRDLKALGEDKLPVLAGEIREMIIDVVSRNGGHLASSLGVVELAICLHYVFDAPDDKIVWDVGHQAYAHKILTGRRKEFATLRQSGGVSGFPRICESPYDTFGAGHASTAISSALGIAAARDLGHGREKVIAILGDGSLTGGLAFEGMNNTRDRARNFIVILNDNEMSISKNVGAMATYLNKIITSPIYNIVKKDIEDIVQRIPAIGQRMVGRARRLEESVKSLIVPGAFFEELGFRYFGPVDGHNIQELLHVLRMLRRIEQPVFLHVLTKKGKGYLPAERQPDHFHGASPFDIKTGNLKGAEKADTYTDVFGRAMLALAGADERVVAISAAMRLGTGLDEFADRFAGRFFDVGIAEEHAVTFAAGMATRGMRPVVAVYSTFLQRAYDQIVHDVCLQKLPVVFAVDRAGVVGRDGATHTGAFDISYLRHIPGLVVMQPADGGELEEMLAFALGHDGPVAIRYPRAKCDRIERAGARSAVETGRWEKVMDGKDVAIVALGAMVARAASAAALLMNEDIEAAVINGRFIKPLDTKALAELAADFDKMVTVEENALAGGFGSSVLEFLSDKGVKDMEVSRLGIPDRFIEHGSRDEILESLGLSAEGIAESIRDIMGMKDK